MAVMRVLAALAYVACSPYDPDLGSTPFACGDTDPKCPDGYACVQVGSGGAVCTTSQGSGSGSCAMAFAGVLATWDLGTAPGSQVSSPASSSATGVVAGAIARSATLVATAGASSINASNWPTSSQLDPASYFTVSITPPAGCVLDVTAMAYDIKSSTTGPTSAAVGASTNAFMTNTVSTTTPGTAQLAVTGASAAVEVRIFGFAAAQSTGTMRVENQLTLTGSVR